MRDYDKGLSAVRYPRDSVSEMFVNGKSSGTGVSPVDDCPPFELGKARPLVEHDTPDAAILGLGTMAIEAMAAIGLLDDEYRVNVYDARFAKPVDVELIRSLIERGIPIITVEDHGMEGGFGSLVIDCCNEHMLDSRLVTRLAIPSTHWIYQGSRKGQLEEAGLDAASIARAVRDVVDKNTSTTPSKSVKHIETKNSSSKSTPVPAK